MNLKIYRKRSESGPTLEELFGKLERRLVDYEDKSSIKFNDLDSKMQVMNKLLENHKMFLEELTDKKNKNSEEKVKNLFEKVYSQDTVCREDREENSEQFEKMKGLIDKIETKFESEVGNVEEKFKSSIAIVLEELQGSIRKVDKKFDHFQTDLNPRLESLSVKCYGVDERLSKVEKNSEEFRQKSQSLSEKENNLEEMKEKFSELSQSVLTFKDKIESSASMIENIEEKMYDFEVSKKNNLIFYGIPAPRNETRHSLAKTLQDILHSVLNITREVHMESAVRLMKGPEVRGCRPVLVTFSYYKDREEIFQKSKLLQTNCSILVTEDMSKKTREARYELQKFLVKLARSRPSKKAFIRYDKLYVDGSVFVFSEEERRVVPHHSQGRLSRASSLSRADSLDRDLSISTPDLSKSSSYFRSPSPSPSVSASVSSQDVSGRDFDSKIKDLESVITQQKTTIHQQKLDIAEHKKIIKKLEMAVQHLYKEDYNLEDID